MLKVLRLRRSGFNKALKEERLATFKVIDRNHMGGYLNDK